jgi:hypothetical protein
MATACLLIGWKRPFPGREREAYALLMGVANEQIEHWRREGWFESYERVGLTPHGGALNGFALLKGERAKLDELRRTDAFERVSMRLALLFDGYAVVPGVIGDGLEKVHERNADLFER